MKRKQLLCLLALAFLLAALSGCAGAASQPAQTEPKETENLYFAENAIPWKYDAREKAMKDGTVEYYFMYCDDVVIERSDGSGTTNKWGDSCLIVLPNGETMLIDSGRGEYAYILSENLRRLGIRKIDYLLFSYCHNDHVGGAVAKGGVLESFEIGKIFYPDVDQNYDYKLQCKAAGLAPEDYEPLIAGDTRTFGDVTMTVLWPMTEHQGQTYTTTNDVNNTSLVINLKYKEHTALFTGDIYRNLTIDNVLNQFTEEQMVEYYLQQGRKDLLDADLLKVPHHGGGTSSSGKLLHAVTPELSIAAGYEQIVEGVRARYGDYTLLSDRECGYIHVTADSEGMLTYECSRYQ